MKTCSKCGIEKSFDQFNKEPRVKEGLSRRCKICHNEAVRISRLKHINKSLKRAKIYRDNNKEKMYELQKNWKKRTKEERKIKCLSLYIDYEKENKYFICSICKLNKIYLDFNKNKANCHGLDYFCKKCSVDKYNEWKKNNPDKVKFAFKNYYYSNKEKIMTSKRIYIENNYDKINALKAKRRSYELHSYVSWGNQDKIKLYYKMANKLTKNTGIKYHVDHIIPLVSDYVCGLHNEFNLQVLTASKNSSKKNRFTPG